MQRWLVILLVILALVILISPGIVGRLAEEKLADGIAWTELDSPGVKIATETFERSWFTSEGRHRVVFEDGQFQEATEIFSAATAGSPFDQRALDRSQKCIPDRRQTPPIARQPQRAACRLGCSRLGLLQDRVGRRAPQPLLICAYPVILALPHCLCLAATETQQPRHGVARNHHTQTTVMWRISRG